MAQEFTIFSVSPSFKHWPVALGLAAVAAMTGAVTLVFQILPAFAALAALGAGAVLTVWPALKVGMTQYEVTSRRVVARTGLLKRERAVPLAEIRDVRVDWGSWGRSLNVGTLRVDGAAGSLLLEGVEDPENVRSQILKLK